MIVDARMEMSPVRLRFVPLILSKIQHSLCCYPERASLS